MPLTSYLLASGSPGRLLQRVTSQQWHPTILSRPLVPCLPLYARTIARLSSSQQPAERPSPEALPGTRSNHETRARATPPNPENWSDIFATNLGLGINTETAKPPKYGFRPQKGSQKRKKQRTSRPAAVLQSLPSTVRQLYYTAPSEDKVDLTYHNPRYSKLKGAQPARGAYKQDGISDFVQPVSLYTILGRYLEHRASSGAEFDFSKQELSLLHREGFNPSGVERWATCLLHPRPFEAIKSLEADAETPPMFVLLLFLRRNNVGTFALGLLLRHLAKRLSAEVLPWASIKILSVRLLRHARKIWPAAMPQVAALFTSQARKLIEAESSSSSSTQCPPTDIALFSNNMLRLISLPVNVNPLIAASHQEKSQFRILQFMASQMPPIIVTQLGFRSVAAVQLTHPKTPQEREWAQLKGPSWPPWKENRTAMDEDKGYEFGASKASRILHRMYEAGYRGHAWEELAELYAGWDSDLSPVVQTRTILPQFRSLPEQHRHLHDLRWAARVRTTRTRREAWACFLSYELSGTTPSQEVYQAMFEKLCAKETEQQEPRRSGIQLDRDDRSNSADTLEESIALSLAGDMKEVLPDPTSPLHYVYLGEPVPTPRQLLHRMYSQGLRPSGRLLSSLMEAESEFEEFVRLLETSRAAFNGGVGQLLDGLHGTDNLARMIPGYFWAAFIRSLCKFSHFGGIIEDRPKFLSSEHHSIYFRNDREYLFVYVQALLRHHKPHYRPAWSAYMAHVVRTARHLNLYQSRLERTTERGMMQYNHICALLCEMDSMGMDIDDEIFDVVCAATVSAMQIASSNGASPEAKHFALHVGSPRLRKLFHGLVGANADTAQHAKSGDIDTVPPHIPPPSALHAYVRALGTLGDYEGLYSFSTWLTRYHAEVTARAEAEVTSGHKRLHRMIVALRVALNGHLEAGNDSNSGASDEIVHLIKAQIEDREEWGGWPDQKWVDIYMEEGERRKKSHVHKHEKSK